LAKLTRHRSRSSPAARDTDPRPLVPFGWQGVRGEAPPDWNLGAIGGDRKSGYLRLDDEEMPRLELKWQQPEGTIDLDKILDTYLRDLRRRTRKQKVHFNVTRGVKILSQRQKRQKDLRGYTFVGEYQAHGIIWHCRSCGRVLISQVLGPEEADLRPLAVRVLGSLEDHTNDNWDLWAAYGMQFRLPDDFALSSHRLMTGQLELAFERNKRERVTVARWALANVLLKRQSLEEWTAGTYKKRHSDFKLEYKEALYLGHGGVAVISESGRMARFVKDTARASILRQPVPSLRCALWHCTHDNKLFAVDSVLLPDHHAVLDYVAKSVKCH